MIFNDEVGKMVSEIKSLATPLQDLILREAMTDRDYANKAAAELLDLRAELATSKARAKTAEENWHKNEARLGRDGLIFMECMKLLGLDVSGTDPEAIPAAIKRLKGVA